MRSHAVVCESRPLGCGCEVGRSANVMIQRMLYHMKVCMMVQIRILVVVYTQASVGRAPRSSRGGLCLHCMPRRATCELAREIVCSARRCCFGSRVHNCEIGFRWSRRSARWRDLNVLLRRRDLPHRSRDSHAERDHRGGRAALGRTMTDNGDTARPMDQANVSSCRAHRGVCLVLERTEEAAGGDRPNVRFCKRSATSLMALHAREDEADAWCLWPASARHQLDLRRQPLQSRRGRRRRRDQQQRRQRRRRRRRGRLQRDVRRRYLRLPQRHRRQPTAITTWPSRSTIVGDDTCEECVCRQVPRSGLGVPPQSEGCPRTSTSHPRHRGPHHRGGRRGALQALLVAQRKALRQVDGDRRRCRDMSQTDRL